MIDVDSRLDARLRAFYEHIEEQRPSRAFQGLEAPRSRPHRRTLNLVAGLAGFAIVATGIGFFATELANRHAVKPPASATRPTLPSSSQLALDLPSISHTVIKATRGRGSASLPTFTPQGILFIQSACVGSGSFSITSPDHRVGMTAEGCDGGSIGGVSVPAGPTIDGTALTLEVSAEPSTEWEIVVADSGPVPPLPLLGSSTIPAGAHILVPATTGSGTSGIQTFFIPAGPYFVQYACVGTTTIDVSLSYLNQTSPFTSASCANGAIRTEEAPKPPGSGVMNLTVGSPPHSFWEVLVYELPAAKS
ncbi:MAG TPA: hypothetical protein VI434_10110 [Candidatus Dormibacteraeota bacterium]